MAPVAPRALAAALLLLLLLLLLVSSSGAGDDGPSSTGYRHGSTTCIPGVFCGGARTTTFEARRRCIKALCGREDGAAVPPRPPPAGRLYISYDNVLKPDGACSQMLRMIVAYGIARRFNLTYVHRGYVGIDYQGLQSMEAGGGDDSFVARWNDFIEPLRAVSEPVSEPETTSEVIVPVLGVEQLLHLMNRARLGHHIEALVTRPFQVARFNPEIYSFAAEIFAQSGALAPGAGVATGTAAVTGTAGATAAPGTAAAAAAAAAGTSRGGHRGQALGREAGGRRCPGFLGGRRAVRVAIHVRRGEIHAVHTERFLPNTYYINLAKRLVGLLSAAGTATGAGAGAGAGGAGCGVELEIHTETPTKDFTVVPGQGLEAVHDYWHGPEGGPRFAKGMDNLHEFVEALPGVRMRVNEDSVETFKAMASADVLVASRSTFSLVAGVLGRGTTILPPRINDGTIATGESSTKMCGDLCAVEAGLLDIVQATYWDPAQVQRWVRSDDPLLGEVLLNQLTRESEIKGGGSGGDVDNDDVGDDGDGGDGNHGNRRDENGAGGHQRGQTKGRPPPAGKQQIIDISWACSNRRAVPEAAPPAAAKATTTVASPAVASVTDNAPERYYNTRLTPDAFELGLVSAAATEAEAEAVRLNVAVVRQTGEEMCATQTGKVGDPVVADAVSIEGGGILAVMTRMVDKLRPAACASTTVHARATALPSAAAAGGNDGTSTSFSSKEDVTRERPTIRHMKILCGNMPARLDSAEAVVDYFAGAEWERNETFK